MFQFLRDLREGGVWAERKKHLTAIKQGMVQLRAMLTEAQESKRVIKTEAENQFVSNIGHNIYTIECHIDKMLEPESRSIWPYGRGK